jgi:hypothetical protein
MAAIVPKLIALWRRDTDMGISTVDTAPLAMLKKGGFSQLRIYQTYCDPVDSQTSSNRLSQLRECFDTRIRLPRLLALSGSFTGVCGYPDIAS